jgi:hypothetical protein
LGRSSPWTECRSDTSNENKPVKVMTENKYKYKSVPIGLLLIHAHE